MSHGNVIDLEASFLERAWCERRHRFVPRGMEGSPIPSPVIGSDFVRRRRDEDEILRRFDRYWAKRIAEETVAQYTAASTKPGAIVATWCPKRRRMIPSSLIGVAPPAPADGATWAARRDEEDRLLEQFDAALATQQRELIAVERASAASLAQALDVLAAIERGDEPASLVKR